MFDKSNGFFRSRINIYSIGVVILILFFVFVSHFTGHQREMTEYQKYEELDITKVMELKCRIRVWSRIDNIVIQEPELITEILRFSKEGKESVHPENIGQYPILIIFTLFTSDHERFVIDFLRKENSSEIIIIYRFGGSEYVFEHEDVDDHLVNKILSLSELDFMLTGTHNSDLKE